MATATMPTKRRTSKNKKTKSKAGSFDIKSSANLVKNSSYLVALVVFAVFSIVLWQFPVGRLILYPFTILGTWFHEMGHGVMAMILGGSFHELEIYSNGSGLARHSGDLFGGRIGDALVAAAGPLGPAIVGSVLIGSVRSQKATKIALWVLGIVMAISVLYFVRSWFGILTISVFAVVTLYANIAAKDKTKSYLLLFLGTQAVLSTYISVDYLLSPGANIGGEVFPSDTMVISNSLFLPYGFWGVAIIFISILLIYNSITKLLK